MKVIHITALPYWIAAGALILALLNVNFTWEDSDEERFVSLARSYAQGMGQQTIFLPDPQPEWLTPPLYPWLLGRIMRLAGEDNLRALMASSAVSYWLAALVVIRMFKRERPEAPVLASLAAVLGLYNVLTLTYIWRIYAEALFTLFFVAAIWSGLESSRQKSMVLVLISAALSGASYMIRPMGLCMPVAGFLHYAFRREWKYAGAFLAFALLVNLPTFWTTYQLIGTPIAYLKYFGVVDESQARAGGTLMNVLQSGPYYFFISLPRQIFFSLFDYRCLMCKLGLGWMVAPAALGVALVTAVGLLSRMRKIGFMEWAWGGYFLAASTHWGWPQERYLIPIIPLTAFYFVRGVEALVDGAGRLGLGRRAEIKLAVIAVCAAYAGLTALGTGLVRSRAEWNNRHLHPWDPQRYERRGNDSDSAWARYVQSALYIKDNLSADYSVMCRKSAHMYLMSGHKAFRYDGVDVPGSNAWDMVLSQQAYGPVVIVEDAFLPESTYGRDRIGMLDPVLAAQRARLELLHETDSPTVRIWRVRPDGP